MGCSVREYSEASVGDQMENDWYDRWIWEYNCRWKFLSGSFGWLATELRVSRSTEPLWWNGGGGWFSGCIADKSSVEEDNVFRQHYWNFNWCSSDMSLARSLMKVLAVLVMAEVLENDEDCSNKEWVFGCGDWSVLMRMVEAAVGCQLMFISLVRKGGGRREFIWDPIIAFFAWVYIRIRIQKMFGLSRVDQILKKVGLGTKNGGASRCLRLCFSESGKVGMGNGKQYAEDQDRKSVV